MIRKMKVMVATCLSCSLILGIDGGTVLAQSQSQLKEKLNTIQKKQQENKNDLASSKKKLSKNKDKQDVVISNLKESEKKIATMNQSINQTKQRVDQNQQDMATLKKEIKKIDGRIKVRGALLRGRIRSIYISGGAVSYLDVLMGSKSFGNFLDRLLALKMITDQDNKIINDQKNDRHTQLTKQKKLQTVLVQTTDALHNLQTMKTGLAQEHAHKKDLLAQLKDQASDIEKTVMSSGEQSDILSAQASIIKQQLADLADREAKKKAEARSQAKADIEQVSATVKSNSESTQKSVSVQNEQQTSAETVSSNNDTSTEHSNASFIMPAAGYISSGFGYRSFDNGFHPGIDIANSTGTPIHAAADGVVFRAYQSSSYGNVVMISHSIGGKIYTTVYAHMSSYSVSSGQSVSQGQVIGSMGSTGESTGSHLHFELYVGPWTPPPHNGAVNPLNYIH
ncbi:murein hydrolase activator EnvC family protein [Sporolactobacillus kofuensis]|uniref:Murein hydrolase activator EnvC family protein n=1 Tax=Sporolactobacillus kofuensis TaxID=269672 RepID=A0ABW1WIV6_9BACL|nr:M23 family metallopeptidase [Sporolactobacillus kofuensis]MCO7176569.1 peptidoglycan DD-metalloendopeptidase family protein [Sporolactobacillus kofuensis]